MEPRCGCMDFEPVDPDDSLNDECACGHLREEHKSGFLSPCKFNPEED